MIYLKTFEDKDNEMHEIAVEIFKEQYRKCPDIETHDLFVFIGKEGFKEVKGGLYKKILEIEKMNKIDPDEQGYNSIIGMMMRAKFTAFSNTTSKAYFIWFPKSGVNLVEDKSSDVMDIGLIELIDKNKNEFTTQGPNGKLFQDAIKKKANIQRFDL